MEYTILIVLVIVGIIIMSIASFINSNKKLKLELENSFGKEPKNQDYDINGINSYHIYSNTTDNNKNQIDDTTWDDLDMDKVFKRINVCCTSVGEEYLYHLLHTQQFNTNELIHREKFISYLKSNESSRLNLQVIFSKLGKKNYSDLFALVSKKELKQLSYHYLYDILALMPFISIAIIPFIQSIGIGFLIASFVANLFVYYILKRKVEFDLISLEYFASMLWCCNKICNINDDNLKPFILDIESNFKVFKSLSSKIPIVPKKGFSDADIFMEYIRILFLSDIRSYNKIVKCIYKNIACFQNLFRAVGEFDTSISILSFRESLPFYCVPHFVVEKTIAFNGIYHPLLSTPISNDAIINNNCIITGSNASGKSTFIKAVAINGILAQTINTCTAHSYSARFSLVMTSMAVKDNITEGDSYFITEIKSLKRILDKIGEIPCLCFIDEILKGTNTIERIASSASVLKSLNETNCLCMVASHDIELTEILKNEYDNYHFAEQVTDDGIYFDYTLKQGASQTRNAIKLLHFMGFNDELVENAEGLVDKFTTNHKWVN